MLVGLLMALSTLSANAADFLYVVGEAVWCGWSEPNNIMMNCQGNDVFKVSVYLNADKDFKFLTQPAWGNEEYRADADGTVLQPGVSANLKKAQGNDNDYKFKVSEAANYDITCDLVNGTIVLTKSAYQENRIDHPNLWIVGDATPGEWSIKDAIQMKQDATDPMKFSATVGLQAGGFKFATNSQTGFDQTMYLKDTSDDSKMVFGGDDSKWEITEPGIYTINVDLATLTISIEKATSFVIDENAASNPSVDRIRGTYDVTLHRTFNPGAWNSLVLPFSLNADQINEAFGSGVKVASYLGATNNSDGTYTLNFKQLEQNAINANVPVIIYGVKASSIEYTFKGVPVETGSTTQTADGFNFVGFGNKATAEAGDWFVSSDNKLYKAQGGESIMATRAVFRSSDTVASSAKELTFSLGNSTGISTIIQNSKDVNWPVYNLSGQRVARSYRGIVIINGKKIINK